MTHVDLGVKQIAAEFLFVLCKERGIHYFFLFPFMYGLAVLSIFAYCCNSLDSYRIMLLFVL